jgi:hypothetical membrane protein
MDASRRIKIFTDKYPLIGPTFYIVCVQYFVTQIIVALNWATTYSLTKNTISDLGNTACGQYSGRYVCSPLHDWMNASFVVLGLTMISGSVLIYQEFRENSGSKLGFTFMALAGFGTVLVGLFPENVSATFHALGALLPFLLGNVALLIFGVFLEIPKAFRIYTVLSGIITIAALALFVTKNYGFLGQGGMERVASYPQTLWLIIFGIYMSRDHFKNMAVRAMQRLRG